MVEAHPAAQAYNLADVLDAAPLLAQAHERLGSDATYYMSQAQRLLSITECLKRLCEGSERVRLKQLLLQDDMQLLQQLLQITAGCMQQLAVQLANPETQDWGSIKVAAFFCDAMTTVVECVAKPKPVCTTPPSSSDIQVLKWLQSTGDFHCLLA